VRDAASSSTAFLPSLLRSGREASELQARRRGIERDAERGQSRDRRIGAGLGVELFIRAPRTLSLTPEGADYLPYVSEALSLIAIGTQRLPHNRANRTIAVSCAPTLASRWLLPRLHNFSKRWPTIGVTVDTSQRHVGFPVDGFDFAIRMSRTTAAGAAWTRLFGERLVPVCSPAYRETLVDEAGNIDLSRARPRP
jgi:LysR family transcriptional regulator, glycine cleavage system transcriptional activator